MGGTETVRIAELPRHAEEPLQIVPDPAKVPPPVEREMPAKGSDREAVPAMPVRPGSRSTHRISRPDAAVPIVRDNRPALAHARAVTTRPLPPHGRKDMPPARSQRERAAGAIRFAEPAGLGP
jgi:hypothetical protein